MATIEERLKKVIKWQFDIDDKQFVLSARLIEDFRADSLDIVEVAMELEREFGLKFGSIDVDNVLTIRKALAYLEEHVQE